jgi:hypothetical protein
LWSDAVHPVPPLAGAESNQIAGLSADVTPPLSAFFPSGQLTLSMAFDFGPSAVEALVTSARPGAPDRLVQIAVVVVDELDGSATE